MFVLGVNAFGSSLDVYPLISMLGRYNPKSCNCTIAINMVGGGLSLEQGNVLCTVIIIHCVLSLCNKDTSMFEIGYYILNRTSCIIIVDDLKPEQPYISAHTYQLTLIEIYHYIYLFTIVLCVRRSSDCLFSYIFFYFDPTNYILIYLQPVARVSH